MRKKSLVTKKFLHDFKLAFFKVQVLCSHGFWKSKKEIFALKFISNLSWKTLTLNWISNLSSKMHFPVKKQFFVTSLIVRKNSLVVKKFLHDFKLAFFDLQVLCSHEFSESKKGHAFMCDLWRRLRLTCKVPSQTHISLFLKGLQAFKIPNPLFGVTVPFRVISSHKEIKWKGLDSFLSHCELSSQRELKKKASFAREKAFSKFQQRNFQWRFLWFLSQSQFQRDLQSLAVQFT